MKRCSLILAFVVLSAVGCQSMHQTPDRYFARKGKNNGVVSLLLPFAGARANVAYNHTLNGFPRTRSDCSPHCPKVEIWQYHYRPDGTETLTSDKPIATLKKHWKVKSEARIIAIGMFNGRKLYADGLVDYTTSFGHIKRVNKIKDALWGYETFTVRIYVAKRSPAKLVERGPLADDTPDDMIEDFLRRGFEVAYVDNGLSRTGKDGTFWRFMVAAEAMPEGERIRYLSRDADAFLSAGEAFSVGEWIASGQAFHRMHIIPICLGPLTAMAWGGSHVGKGPFSDMKNMIEYFPYRFQYGDDELFTRDMVWPRIKAMGSVMTHQYERGVFFRAVNPYRGSCEEPTQDYCDEAKLGGKCPDVSMPKEIESPWQALGLRGKLSALKDNLAMFDLHPETVRGKRAIEALRVN